MGSILEIFEEVRKRQNKKHVIVANATIEEVVVAKEAIENEIADFTLVGNRRDIEDAAEAINFDIGRVNIIHEEEPNKTIGVAIRYIEENKADLIMKGQVQTAKFMSKIIGSETFYKEGERMSQITAFDGLDGKLKFLTDCAINVSPDFGTKVTIIENAVYFANLLGLKKPKVAILDAIEYINPKLETTIDAATLTQMNRRGQIKNCVIDGPLSFDNALFKDYATIKNIDSEVAGNADILFAHELSEANNLSKSIIHYAQRPAASIIAGIKQPIIMTSRTDRKINKLYTIALQCYLVDRM